jgi:hypothetical protein
MKRHRALVGLGRRAAIQTGAESWSGRGRGGGWRCPAQRFATFIQGQVRVRRAASSNVRQAHSVERTCLEQSAPGSLDGAAIEGWRVALDLGRAIPYA